MTVERITRSSQVLAVWEFFDEGLSHLQEIVKLKYEPLAAKKLICNLASDEIHGYVSVVFLDDGEPVAFVIARDDTLPFSNYRTFVAHAVYYKQGHSVAVQHAMASFENWARACGVRRYSVLARRATTAVRRCFQHEKYGFRRMSLVFEKDIL